MIITEIESIKLRYWPENPPRDGLSSISAREVFLVKIHINKGIFGVGEAFALGSVQTLESIIDEVLAPLLVGEDPTNIEYIWSKMYKLTFRIGRRGIMLAAISAIDIGLWDLLGKVVNMPVYKLLGGFSSTIKAYASGGYYTEGKTIQDLMEEAEGYKKSGFTSMKMKIGGLSIDEDIERILAVKQVLGNDVKLAIDANNSYNITEAMNLCKQLEDLKLLFFEKPLSSDFVEQSSHLANLTSIPIAGYETEYTRFGFKRLIDVGAVNIIQIDAIWSGGISECKKIAALASAAGLSVIPHFSAGAVSLAANLHVSLSIENCNLFEYTLDDNPLRDDLSLTPHKLDTGNLIINEKPGLGVLLNEDVIRKYRIG